MGHNWQHNPVLVLIRDIRNSEAFDPVVQRHVLNWIDSFREGVLDDPVAQVTASLVCRAYATHARLANASLKIKPSDEGAAQLMKMQMDSDLHLLKCLRIGGFRAKGRKTEKAKLFTAPKSPKRRDRSDNRDLPPDLSPESEDDGTHLDMEAG